ncbi:MAG TPA: NADH-quinone oxidoreductase subunit A [Candidatus Limnocylindria bacterium]|nr:NADH-quinone oxidoreductase subunit A [Candidatus Limnocylindria bacterium]
MSDPRGPTQHTARATGVEMDHTGLLYVIGFGFAATTFVFGTILFSWLITHRRRRPQKGLPYESGVDTIGDTWSRFGLAFYLYALLFVAFDVEIIFVYLWAITVRALEFQGIVLIGIFLAILMFGELYAWKKGDLKWQ